MIFVLCTAIVCVALLFAQRQEHRQRLALVRASGEMAALERRLGALEGARATQYDQAAFDDLKNKVETLRMAQGLKGSR